MAHTALARAKVAPTISRSPHSSDATRTKKADKTMPPMAPHVAKRGSDIWSKLRRPAVSVPGLVHRVARVLRELNVNIESLDTRLTAAPYTGSPVFEMELVVSVPRTTPVAQLRHRLGIVCDELNVDWELAPL